MKPTVMLCAALLLAPLTVLHAAELPQNIHDNFDSGSWSPAWKKEIPFGYSAKIVDDPAGPGKCLALEWRRADFDGERPSKGVELKTGHYFPTVEKWSSFRLYFSSRTFGVDSRPVIFAQWHDVPDFKLGEGWRNPITAFSYQNGKIRFNALGDKERLTKGKDGIWEYTTRKSMELGAPKMDAWNTFLCHHRFDPTGDTGLVEIWFNGQRFALENINVGFNDQTGPYWKFGFYYYEGKSDFESRVALFDDVRIGDSREEVTKGMQIEDGKVAPAPKSSREKSSVRAATTKAKYPPGRNT